MKLPNLKVYQVLIMWLITAFLLCSCGARKSTVNKSQEQTKSSTVDNSSTTTTQDTNVKTTTTVKVDDKNQTVTEETTIEPEDKNKEAFIIEKDGTKTVLNNLKKTTTKTIKTNDIQTKIDNNTQEVKKEAIHEQKAVAYKEVSKKENRLKHTEKSNTPWYYWLLLLIPFGFIYWLGKWYKIF